MLHGVYYVVTVTMNNVISIASSIRKLIELIRFIPHLPKPRDVEEEKEDQDYCNSGGFSHDFFFR